MGQLLHQVSLVCGDRPQLGRLLQNPSGEILAAFFTVTAKKQDGQPMAGLALVSVLQNGNATAAILADHADRFPSSVNSLFQRLKQEMGAAQPSATKQNAPADGASAGTVPAASPQPLQPSRFADGSGVIGLPAGWTVVRAQLGDEERTVAAIFPNYSRNSAFVNSKINQQIQVGIEQTNQFVHDVQVHMDNSDRFTAGMSDFLRNQTVIVDTREGGHARTSDQLADLLMQTDPNRFQAVLTSQYIRGFDCRAFCSFQFVGCELYLEPAEVNGRVPSPPPPERWRPRPSPIELWLSKTP
jgi:hypothetical protein